MIEGLELAIGWHRREAKDKRALATDSGRLDRHRQAWLEMQAEWHDKAADALTRIALS